MKYLILGVCLLSVQAFANLQVIKLEETQTETMLFLNNGEIVEIENTNTELIDLAREAHTNQYGIEISKISHNLETPDLVSSIKLIPRYPQAANTQKDRRIQDPLYSANLSQFSTYDQAQSLMDTFNGSTDDDSQCYNRAHMWTYEAAVVHGENLGKLWIFFTRRYIREYRYKWWFHVSPYAEVNDGNERYVLDRGFTMVPYNVTNWKNLFMKNQANCPVVERYSDYEDNQRSQYCYLIYSSQFYWQPQHLERLENRNQIQNRYNESDLRITYRDALTRWNGSIPRLGMQPRPAPRTRPNTRPDVPTTRPEPRPQPRPRPEPRPRPQPERRALSVGEWIISSNGVDGQVTGRANEHQVYVKYTTERNSLIQNTRDLAVRYGSVGGFYVGQAIMSTNRVRGTVTGVYLDGMLAVQYETVAGHMRQHPSQLRRR